jgi:hypothetical protein
MVERIDDLEVGDAGPGRGDGVGRHPSHADVV